PGARVAVRDPLDVLEAVVAAGVVGVVVRVHEPRDPRALRLGLAPQDASQPEVLAVALQRRARSGVQERVPASAHRDVHPVADPLPLEVGRLARGRRRSGEALEAPERPREEHAGEGAGDEGGEITTGHVHGTAPGVRAFGGGRTGVSARVPVKVARRSRAGRSSPPTQPRPSSAGSGTSGRSSPNAIAYRSQSVRKSAATIGPTMTPRIPNIASPPKVERS